MHVTEDLSEAITAYETNKFETKCMRHQLKLPDAWFIWTQLRSTESDYKNQSIVILTLYVTCRLINRFIVFKLLDEI